MNYLLIAIFKFCTTNQLFKYFRKRYSDQQINILNKLVRVRGRVRALTSSTAFLKACISQRTLPKFIQFRIEKSHAKHSPTIERAFMKDNIEKNRSLVVTLRKECHMLWQEVRSFLSFFDLFRFCRYVAIIDDRKERSNRQKNERNLSLLSKHRFGNNASVNTKNIVNLSDYKLSSTEEFVLSHGLNFCLPPTTVKREEVFSEFEVLIAQLQHHTHQSIERRAALTARLSDLAHAYCGNPVDTGDFLMKKECFQAVKSLSLNNNIIITKPDKGSGVVIINKTDYVSKMESILHDESKFQVLGPVHSTDNTAKLESRLQRRLLKLYKDDILESAVYEAIRPTGSLRPRMYGLPKTHKKDVPLRPILSMTGSAQHQLAKWLASILDPVLSLYSTHCICDSFTFVESLRTSGLKSSSTFLCSFDVSSLFTNVPLVETINICADALYNGLLTPPSFPREVFVELMKTATCSVEFSFNNIMYRQIDGVAMGSPLGPALANIFVGYYETLLFNNNTKKPLMYHRYVDDTFVAFDNERDCDEFLSRLNSLHPSLLFTFEKESNNSLPFLDVLVEKSGSDFITSIYRKPTFTGQYLRWNSFSPKKRKIDLINTLVHRALKICSKCKLQAELDKIRSILVDNGYPAHVIDSSITRKVKQANRLPCFGPKKCPVYLHLPYLGAVSQRFEKQITSSVKRCYFSVEPRIVFTTRCLLPATKKDVLPALQQSNIIYEFSCHCDSRYVGRTSQRLQDRIKQHVPKSIRTGQSSQDRSQLSRSCKLTNNVSSCESAIGQHLLDSPACASEYNDKRFSILASGRSSFHLAALEATFIKTSRPNLCRQKQFVYVLKIGH